jgi:FAD/FMN-containing dehydrogenase
MWRIHDERDRHSDMNALQRDVIDDEINVLTVTTPQLWPINAKKLLEKKNVDTNELKTMFTNVLFPWDDGYDSGRTFYSIRIEHRPLFIVKPVSTTEIERILDYVNDKRLTVMVMNGRHTSSLKTGEVMVDMSFFVSKELCGETLVAGAGNTQGMLNDYLFNVCGLSVYSPLGSFTHPRVNTNAFPGGSAASVGSAGISTAGGVGSLCRTYALTVDSVKSYKITVPPTNSRSAKTMMVSKKKHPNLFWALRGGVGSNFGIISEITYKIIEVPKIMQYSIYWDWDNATNLLHAWKKNSKCRPYWFNEDVALYVNPETKFKGIELSGIYVMVNGKSTEDAVKEIHEQLDPIVEPFNGELHIKEPMIYSDLYKQMVRGRPYFNYSIIQTMFSDKLDPEQVVRLIEKGGGLNGPISISFTLLGGKIDDVSSKEMAFYPRKRRFFVDIASFWQSATDGQSIDNWTNRIVDDLLDDNTYAYVGFPITFSNIKRTNRVYYGRNYDKLKEIKRHYDPLNILTYCGTIE